MAEGYVVLRILWNEGFDPRLIDFALKLGKLEVHP